MNNKEVPVLTGIDELPACSSSTSLSATSTNEAGPIRVYDAGGQHFHVFEGAERLRSEFRLVCHSIYRPKDEANTLPALPLIVQPEQLQVLLEHGFAQVWRVKEPAVGHPEALNKRIVAEEEDMEESEDNIRKLARQVVIGRKLKARKRALLGPYAHSGALKVRKLDWQQYAREEEKCAIIENGGGNQKLLLGEKADKEAMETAETTTGEEMDQAEFEQTVQELKMREQEKKQKQSGRMVLSYGLPSTSSNYEFVAQPHFPQTAEYTVRLTVFRDLWRKGFYLTSGAKFGCDYLAYEKPPGTEHSRFMVVCTDVNNALKPLSLVGTARTGTQVKKKILLAVVSPGAPVPYYMEMNWWKGDGINDR